MDHHVEALRTHGDFHRINCPHCNKVIRDLWDCGDGLPICLLEIQAMGLTDDEVTSMMDRNDSLRRYSEYDRYKRMVEWLRAEDSSGEVDDAR